MDLGKEGSTSQSGGRGPAREEQLHPRTKRLRNLRLLNRRHKILRCGGGVIGIARLVLADHSFWSAGGIFVLIWL